MMIVTYEVTPLLEVLKCDCGGEMNYTGGCLTSNPPTFAHVCSKCDRQEGIRTDTFPRNVWERGDWYSERELGPDQIATKYAGGGRPKP